MQQPSIRIACSIPPLQESVAHALAKLGYAPVLSSGLSRSCKLKHRAPDPLPSLDAPLYGPGSKPLAFKTMAATGEETNLMSALDATGI
jgi:hypothetical protein